MKMKKPITTRHIIGAIIIIANIMFITLCLYIFNKAMLPAWNMQKFINCSNNCNVYVRDQVKKLNCNKDYISNKEKIMKQLNPCLEQCKKKHFPEHVKKKPCVYEK